MWDDAVIKTGEADGEWMETNLGSWMSSYFGHDALFVLHPDGEAFYHYLADTADAVDLAPYQRAYAPLVTWLRSRLRAGDDTGVTDQVLTIGESDLAVIGTRPAIVSASRSCPTLARSCRRPDARTSTSPSDFSTAVLPPSPKMNTS